MDGVGIGWKSPPQHQLPASPPALPSAAPGLTMQEVLVRVGTQGWPGTPTPEDHGLMPQEVSSEASIQLPAWGQGRGRVRPEPHSRASSLPSGTGQLPLPMPTRPGHYPPTKALANGRLGSCGHRPRPPSTLPGSRRSTCWGGGGRRGVLPGEATPAPQLGRGQPSRAAAESGWEDGALTQGLSSEVRAGHKGAFQAPAPGSGSGRKCHCFPPLVGSPKAHLPTVPNCDEGTDGLEGPGATCQQVGPVVGLQHPHEVGTLRLWGEEECRGGRTSPSLPGQPAPGMRGRRGAGTFL